MLVTWSHPSHPPFSAATALKISRGPAKLMSPTASSTPAWLGCLLGGYVGDAAGATVEFQHSVTEAQAQWAMTLPGGGPHRVAPGQVTDDSELDMALVHALHGCGGCGVGNTAGDRQCAERAAAGYIQWLNSDPFDVGNTTSKAFHSARSAKDCESNSAQLCQGSLANGALMRIAPLAVWFVSPRRRRGPPAGAGDDEADDEGEDEQLAELARADARLSHPNAVCQAANAAFCVALARVLRGAAPAEAVGAALAVLDARPACAGSTQVAGWIRDESTKPLHEIQARCRSDVGYVHHALVLAFHFLRREVAFEQALFQTLCAGGDTDTNAKIVCNLVGARDPDGVPERAAQVVREFDCTQRFGDGRVGRLRPAPYRVADALAVVASWMA